MGRGQIFNISNYKFPLWLVEVTLGCFSSCISLVAVKSNFILFRSGCAAHTVLVAQPILFRLRSPYCLGCAAHTGGNSDNKANSAQLGGAGAWAELGNKKPLILDTLFSIFNVSNYKFPLWLVEVTLD